MSRSASQGLAVPCPICGGNVGRRCRRPSGHQAQDPHTDRDRAAMAAGLLKKCPGETRFAKKDLKQDLFAKAT